MLAPLPTYLDHLGDDVPAIRRERLTRLYRLLADRPHVVVLHSIIEYGTPERPAWGVNGRAIDGADLNVSAIVKMPFDDRAEAVAYHQAIAAMIQDARIRVEEV